MPIGHGYGTYERNMYIIKINGFKYECKHEAATLFCGRHHETLAFCHWNYGIPKDQVRKALELLDNRALKIFFDTNNNIMLDNPMDLA